MNNEINNKDLKTLLNKLDGQLNEYNLKKIHLPSLNFNVDFEIDSDLKYKKNAKNKTEIISNKKKEKKERDYININKDKDNKDEQNNKQVNDDEKIINDNYKNDNINGKEKNKKIDEKNKNNINYLKNSDYENIENNKKDMDENSNDDISENININKIEFNDKNNKKSSIVNSLTDSYKNIIIVNNSMSSDENIKKNRRSNFLKNGINENISKIRFEESIDGQSINNNEEEKNVDEEINTIVNNESFKRIIKNSKRKLDLQKNLSQFKSEIELFKDSSRIYLSNRNPFNENNDESQNDIEKVNTKKILDKLPPEEKNAILKILDNINNFQPSEPNDISEYELISEFDSNEKNLDDLYPNFIKMISQEIDINAKNRKLLFMNRNYFQGKIEAEADENLMELAPEIDQHCDLMTDIYEKEKLKNLPKINLNENFIFPKDLNLMSEYESPIGKIENIESFIYKYSCKSNFKLIKNIQKTFDNWRPIKSDGNSFYRVFMFSLIEVYIISKNIDQLTLLISEITCDECMQLYKNKKLNYEIPFIILAIILDKVKNNKIEEAHEFFLKCYLLPNYIFDKILIIYLRHVIYKFVQKITDLDKENNFDDTPKDKKKICTEIIELFNIEPNYLILCIIPFIYDINLSILWVDNNLNQSKDGIINFIDEDNRNSIPLISIAFFFSSFHKIYPPDFTKQYNLFIKNEPKIEKLTFVVENKSCEICKNKTKHIIFMKQKFIVCRHCLENHIFDTVQKRNKALDKNNYIGGEYYTRSIHLLKKFYINEYEFIEIYNENIINYLQSNSKTYCNKCKKIFNLDQINKLKCRCLYCDQCLEEILIKFTNGNIILNSYEKVNMKKLNCSCGAKFDYDDIINHYKNIENADKKDAKERLINYINSYCFICGVKVKKQNEIIKDNRKIRIKKQNDEGNGLNYLDIEHVACIECFDKNFRNGKKDESKNSAINYKDGSVFCKICQGKHYLLDKYLGNETNVCSSCNII